MRLKKIPNFCLLILACWLMACSSDKQKKTEPVSLFDGESLTGWEGDSNWFRVEEGAIVAGSLEKEIPHNYFLCTTKAYDDFELKAEAKLIGDANSGIQFRSRRVPEDTEVSGYQADIGGAIGDFGIVWGSLYDESRRNKMLVVANQEEISKVVRSAEWNEMVVKCQNNQIRVWINGYLSADYSETDESIEKKGLIGLQIHSGAAAEAWFRNITLTEL